MNYNNRKHDGKLLKMTKVFQYASPKHYIT